MAGAAYDQVTPTLDRPTLVVLGLTDNEETAYSWLVDKGAVTVSEIVAAWERWWSTELATATLAALHGKGLITFPPGPSAIVLACPPESVLQRQIALQETALTQARRRVADLEERYRLAPNNTGAIDIVDVVYGMEAIQQRTSMLYRTGRDIRVFDKPPYFVDIYDSQLEMDRLASGARYRGIYDRSALEIPGYLTVIERLIDAGEEARVFDGVPMKLGLVDDREAFIPLQRDPTVVAELFVRSSALLDALSELFELVWERAIPFGAAVAGRALQEHQDERPTPAESHLLSLLVTGISDETICRRLGISQRTLQRRLQRLEARVGAQTRFQLAHQATRRGWL